MFVILNLMSDASDPAGQIDFDRTVSVLGYGLLPIIVLAIFHIFVPLQCVAPHVIHPSPPLSFR